MKKLFNFKELADYIAEGHIVYYKDNMHRVLCDMFGDLTIVSLAKTNEVRKFTSNDLPFVFCKD